MSTAVPSSPADRRAAPRRGLRVWHLWLLSLFVAVAIVEIRNERRGEPTLIALASAGYALYGLLGWIGWRLARRLEDRLGRVGLLAVYLTGMAALYMVAVVVYLALERLYLNGRW
jgi:hypothetical protein